MIVDLDINYFKKKMAQSFEWFDSRNGGVKPQVVSYVFARLYRKFENEILESIDEVTRDDGLIDIDGIVKLIHKVLLPS